ncbi:hypothetical protein BYT27DRAFT_7201626, partial [Phlegmacium glaucopus]
LDVFAFRLLFRSVHDPWSEIYTPSIVEKFLGYQHGELQIILADLHSVIFVPSPSLNSNSEEDQLRIFHASLGDFLLDRSRSGDLFIDASEAHARMAENCIQHVTPMLEMGGKWKIDQHLDIAYKNLMTECMNAYPTKELLHQLRPFRFDRHLMFASGYLSIGDSWNVIMKHLPGFIRWIQQQVRQSFIFAKSW